MYMYTSSHVEWRSVVGFELEDHQKQEKVKSS